MVTEPLQTVYAPEWAPSRSPGDGYTVLIHLRRRCAGERAQLALLSLLCIGLGAVAALGLARAAGYGWFSEPRAEGTTSNLTPNEAHRIAREYAEQQLVLVEAASALEQRIPPGIAARQPEPKRIGMDAERLVIVDSQFISADASAGPQSKPATAGAWLFIFRVDGIPVAEWRTGDGTLEIQVLLSDVSGRMLQAGVTLFPSGHDRATAIR